MSVHPLSGNGPSKPSKLSLPDLLDAIEWRLDEEGAKFLIELRVRLNRLVAEAESRQMEAKQREERAADELADLRGLA